MIIILFYTYCEYANDNIPTQKKGIPIWMSDYYLQLFLTASDFIMAVKYLLSSITLTQNIARKPLVIGLYIYFGATTLGILGYAIYNGKLAEIIWTEFSTTSQEFALFCDLVSPNY